MDSCGFAGVRRLQTVRHQVAVDSQAPGRTLAEMNLPGTVQLTAVVREKEMCKCGECGSLQVDASTRQTLRAPWNSA